MVVNRKYGIGMLKNSACRKHKGKKIKDWKKILEVGIWNKESMFLGDETPRKQQTSHSYKLDK